MIKHIFLDCETTGPDYQRNGLYQIGGIIRYDKVYEEFEFQCDIFAEDEIDPMAFDPKNTNVQPEDLMEYPDPLDTYNNLIKIFSKHVDKFNKNDKMIFVNFFASFDYDFLRRWFESNGDKYFGSWIFNPPLGLESLAMEYLKDKRATMPNFKLTTVCKELGIPVDEKKTHTALYDASLALLLYDKIKYNDDVPNFSE